MSDNIFNLISFSPVGFKQACYPTPYCAVCRGLLNEPCSKCTDDNIEICPVIDNDESYYHSHCFSLIKDKLPKK